MAKKRTTRRKTSRKEIKPIETRSFFGRDDARKVLLATAALLDQDQDFVVAVVFGRMQGEVGGHFKSWTIDVEAGTADYRIVGHRQLRPMNPPFKAKSFVDELVASILDGKVDDRFKFDDGGDLRINTGLAVPGAGIPKQTLIERRKRFRTALCDRLKEAGWIEVSRYRFRKTRS